MRKSIASSFAAALVVSALAPMTLFAQNTAAPTTAPAATATPGNSVTQPGMRKFNKSFTPGNRAMMTRNNGKWRNRQLHRTMPYGRHNGTNRANWGNTGAVSTATPTSPAINNGAAATTKQTATGAKRMNSTHKGHSGKHKATNNSAKHVARHSGSSGQNAKVTHVSHRR